MAPMSSGLAFDRHLNLVRPSHSIIEDVSSTAYPIAPPHLLLVSFKILDFLLKSLAMSLPKLCTQMPVPDGIQGLADTLAIMENPRNGHQLSKRRKIAAFRNGGERILQLALPVASMW